MGVAAREMHADGDGLARLHRSAAANPAQPQIWRQLADALDVAGDRSAAAATYLRHIECATADPALMRAAAALHANDIPVAERLLKSQLKQAPTDVVAIRMLAELAVRLDRCEDARNLLERCLELAPDFREARHHYALVLHRLNEPAAALAQLDTLLRETPDDPGVRNLKAAVLCRTGEYDAAISIYAQLLDAYPDQAQVWLSSGHALKTAGHAERAIAAYRRCIQIDPDYGEAWWSLANLKTFRFSDADIDTIRHALAKTNLADEHRLHLDFALGKALEDQAQYADAFAHYANGNALRLKLVPYSADDTSARLQRTRETYTADFFHARDGAGCAATDPIFIVGLPRAGSTLIEQILASHPQVEGTMELPDLVSITRRLRARAGSRAAGAYHEALAQCSREELRELGQAYLAGTRIHRKTGRPFFIDKMPNNFAHVGLIHLILPNAKIIDARRHPLACCFSGFKQHFARGQNFSYSLTDLGRYWRDYAQLMAHFEAVLPGRVHRVHYEAMVADTENEVRRLLAFCGLPYDDACLRFFENDRPVRTASSEQVRQPIYRGGVDQWRHFEPWLDPLKAALGPALDAYPLPQVFHR